MIYVFFSMSAQRSLLKLVGCGRVAVRGVVSGTSSRLAVLAESNNSCSIGSSSCLDTNSSTLSPAAAATVNNAQHHRLLTVRVGLAKDLVGGPSTVNDANQYGDDACFIANHSLADVFGVADGVGGWRSYGIDPSKFSRRLMQECAQLVSDGKFRPQRPELLLAAAYQLLYKHSLSSTLPSSDKIVGSSTACVVCLDRASGLLHTANLGDSGFLVFRSGKVVHRSHEQQHYFNTPFQLSLPPMNADSNDFLSDSPESADTSEFSVEEGDLILVATDGLFDNLSTKMIENEISAMEKADEWNLQSVANSLVLQARRLAFDVTHMSPFATKARKHGFAACGGKPDDITIILALVTFDNKEEEY